MRVNLRQTAVLTSERASPGGPMGKESTCNAGDTEDVGSITGLGRSHGGGHGNPLQYSCLENPKNRGAWQAPVHRAADRQTTTEATEHACTQEVKEVRQKEKETEYSSQRVQFCKNLDIIVKNKTLLCCPG